MKILIELGNKKTKVSCESKSLIRPTAITIFHKGVMIPEMIGNKVKSKNTFYDLLLLLGRDYDDEKFRKIAKFYQYLFNRRKEGKIDIVLSDFKDIKKISVETILAIFIKLVTEEFRHKYLHEKFPTYKCMIDGCRFFVTIQGHHNHAYRYGLWQSFQIIEIENPIFLNSCHLAITHHYSQLYKHNDKSENAIVIEFGDQGCTIMAYKMLGKSNIVETLDICYLEIGGRHLTAIISEFCAKSLKEKKGLDVSGEGVYMSMIDFECENLKIHLNESHEKDSYITFDNLPNQTAFGMAITGKMLDEIISVEIEKVYGMIEKFMLKWNSISEILLFGGSTKMKCFKEKLAMFLDANKNIVNLEQQNICKQFFEVNQDTDDIIVLDISGAIYEVTGEEGFKRKLMDYCESIPERKSSPTRFPAGELEFNLKISENKVKVAHFLLDSRPKQAEFDLSFEINRNKLISLCVLTHSGQIELIANYSALSASEIYKEKEKITFFESLSK